MHKSAGQGLHNFVVHGAGKQRMRMRNHSRAPLDATWRKLRQVLGCLNATSRALKHKSTGV
jgi:hypothetical protein